MFVFSFLFSVFHFLYFIFCLYSLFSFLFFRPLGMQLEAQQAMLTGRTVFPYFVLKVSREQIVTDTLTQLLLIDESDLKKPLKVRIILIWFIYLVYLSCLFIWFIYLIYISDLFILFVHLVYLSYLFILFILFVYLIYFFVYLFI